MGPDPDDGSPEVPKADAIAMVKYIMLLKNNSLLLKTVYSVTQKKNLMKKLLAAGAFLLALTACNNNSDSGNKSENDTSNTKKETSVGPANNVLTDQDKADGWKLLFDGQTTAGWHKYGGAAAGAAWKVNDGVLFLDTSSKKDWQTANGGDIASDDEYENFDWKLEWKISPAGNSGVMFYVHEDTTKFKYSYESGPEMQIVDNEGHEDGKIIKHRAGDLRPYLQQQKNG
jgi:hypothetical protein